MKIETFLDSYGVRNMCIAHDYCTCMDNDQYSKMLNWGTKPPSEQTKSKRSQDGLQTAAISPTGKPKILSQA